MDGVHLAAAQVHARSRKMEPPGADAAGVGGTTSLGFCGFNQRTSRSRRSCVACGTSTERQRPPAVLSANAKTTLRDSGGRRSSPAAATDPDVSDPVRPHSRRQHVRRGTNLTPQASTPTPQIPTPTRAPRPRPRSRTSGGNGPLVPRPWIRAAAGPEPRQQLDSAWGAKWRD
jgi:hypothetical protein